MRQPSLLRRYILFFCGVLCAALGIALITLAGMGTSAVSSLSYVLTFVFPGLSLGVFTFLVNCTMLVGQVLLLRHRFQSIQLLQIPATLLFSVCIDLWTELLAPLVPESYGARWGVLLLGCLSLGLGVALEVLPNVLILPCEGLSEPPARYSAGILGRPRPAMIWLWCRQPPCSPISAWGPSAACGRGQ